MKWNKIRTQNFFHFFFKYVAVASSGAKAANQVRQLGTTTTFRFTFPFSFLLFLIVLFFLIIIIIFLWKITLRNNFEAHSFHGPVVVVFFLYRARHRRRTCFFFINFYRVLPSFLSVSHCFLYNKVFDWFTLVLNRKGRVLSGFLLILLGFTGFYRVFTEFYLVITGFYWIFIEFTEFLSIIS